MADYRTRRPAAGSSKRRKKKKWTKKRIKRYARAYFFRFLGLLIVLAILFLVVTGVKLVVKGVSSLFGGGSGSPKQEEVMTEEETTEHVPVTRTLTLTATGDCTLGKAQSQDYDGSFVEYYDDNGENYFFDGVRDIFEKDDLTLLNLECVLTESNDRVEKQFNLKGLPSYTGIMTGSSVEAVSLGNNHSADYGEQSLLDTESNLDAAGIVWAINENLGTYTTKDGLKVGIVSKEIITYTEEKEQILLDGIKKLQDQGVDLIVAACHWGQEKEYYATDDQKKVAHDLIDAGADVVIGNHPHVLEGIEVYKGKVICYSLGNFCFGGNRNPSDKNTMIFQQTFTFVDDELQSDLDAKIIPCRISSVSDHNDFQPTVAVDSKQNIINNVNNYSEPLGDVKVDENGIIHSESFTPNAAAETQPAETEAESETETEPAA